MTTISRHLVPDSQRVSVTARLFGHRFPTRVEPFVYNVASRLTKDYRGGYWAFYTLSEGGFYMAPEAEHSFHVVCQNYFEGDLSADALGITACLYVYSHLSSLDPPEFADVCGEQYQRLREFMLGHPEVAAISGAID